MLPTAPCACSYSSWSVCLFLCPLQIPCHGPRSAKPSALQQPHETTRWFAERYNTLTTQSLVRTKPGGGRRRCCDRSRLLSVSVLTIVPSMTLSFHNATLRQLTTHDGGISDMGSMPRHQIRRMGRIAITDILLGARAVGTTSATSATTTMTATTTADDADDDSADTDVDGSYADTDEDDKL